MTAVYMTYNLERGPLSDDERALVELALSHYELDEWWDAGGETFSFFEPPSPTHALDGSVKLPSEPEALEGALLYWMELLSDVRRVVPGSWSVMVDDIELVWDPQRLTYGFKGQ